MSFFEILRKCTSFHWNVNYVSDGSYYYVKTIFQHACRNGIQITWFWRWTQNKLFNFIFWRTFKNVHFRSNFWFSHLWNTLYFIWKFGTDSFNFIHKIPREMITKWFYWCEFWQSRRWNSMQNVIYWIQRRRGLPEFSEITSAKYFDLAFVIILLHRWHWCL